VALAAGHRPCGLCRRPDYLSYREAVSRSGVRPAPGAVELNRRLARERLRRGRGLKRAADRITWGSRLEGLPDGTVIVDDEHPPELVLGDRLLTFTFAGWSDPRLRPSGGSVAVLTPPTSVAALRHGFVPTLHPSADV
jgi:hypothetical protein